MPNLPLLPSEPNQELVGRRALIDEVLGAAGQERRLFAFEGDTGVGKSALLSCIATELRDRDHRVAMINAADQASEELAIAAIYEQLKEIARDPEAVANALQRRIRSEWPSVLRKFFAAAVADVAKLVAEKAENTIEATRQLIAGEDEADDASADIDALGEANRRVFLREFLQALDDAGNQIAIGIDNVDLSNLTEFIRWLVKAKSPRTVILLTHNTERGDNRDWDYIVADVKSCAGLSRRIDVLTRCDIEQWFHRDIGRWPSSSELDALVNDTHGRAYDLKLALEAVRDRSVSPLAGDYSDYYALKRRSLSGENRTVAELLSVIPYDFSVLADHLAVAAAQLGVSDVGPALDCLREDRLLKEEGAYVALRHTIAQDAVRSGLSTPRQRALREAWYAPFSDLQPNQLTTPGVSAVIPLICSSLVISRPMSEIAEIGTRLIEAGQSQTGLLLLDASWKFGKGAVSGEIDMIEHALLAARTRLDLGRYSEVDEPLTLAEGAASRQEDKVQVVLLRMKLALRRNTYSLLWVLAEELDRLAPGDSDAQAEGQSTLNVAHRDLLDYVGIKETTNRMIVLRPTIKAKKRMAVDRSIARALAKLGQLPQAQEFAEGALQAASEFGSVSDVGNAYLARAEAYRYSAEYDEAVIDYRKAEEIGRGTGNRDSQLWSLLGEAAAQIERGAPEKASSPLDQVTALLAEPGYDHPLEAAHFSLLSILASQNVEVASDVIKTYGEMGIHWPAKVLDEFITSRSIAAPIPL